MIRKSTCLVLACAIVMNLGLSAVAEHPGVPLNNQTQNPISIEETQDGDPTEDLNTPETPVEGDTQQPDEPPDPSQGLGKPNPPSRPGAEPPDGTTTEGETPEAGETQFQIQSVTVQTNPQPLTSKGGTAVFTVAGQFLNQEHIWLKLDKSGQPYRIIPVSSKTGLWDNVKGFLLPSSNVTSLRSDAVTLDAASAETLYLYTASLYHSQDAAPPDIDSDSWQQCDIEPIVVPKEGGDKPEPLPLPEDDLTVGSSQPENPADPEEPAIPESPEEEPENPDPEEPSSPEELVPGMSDPTTEEPEAPVEPKPEPPPETPAPPEDTTSSAAITGAETSAMPSPITADGGFAMVGVFGRNLDKGDVWVKVTSDSLDLQTLVLNANQGKSTGSVYTEKFPIPRNDSNFDVTYQVSVLHRDKATSAPDASAEDWQEMPGASLIVPKAVPTEVPPIEEGQLGKPRIDSVQTVTTPVNLTSIGGLACVTITGIDLDKGKLWVMLDDGSKPIIKKFQDVSPSLAVSQQFNLPANTEKSDVKYKVSVMNSDSVTAPRAGDAGWKKYSDAVITVPKLQSSEKPVISDVLWTPEVNGAEIKTRFFVSGSNLDQGENSTWIMITPKGSTMGAKIIPADQSLSSNYAETAEVILKQKTSLSSKEPLEYEVFAMAKTDSKKPSAGDDQWKSYSSRNLAQPDLGTTKPRVTAALVSPTTLTGDGGSVVATIAGENLGGQSVYVVGSPVDGKSDPITKKAVLDETTGDMKIGFDLPPVPEGETGATYNFQYQMGKSADFTNVGLVELNGAASAGTPVAPTEVKAANIAPAKLSISTIDSSNLPVSPIPQWGCTLKIDLSGADAGQDYYIQMTGGRVELPVKITEGGPSTRWTLPANKTKKAIEYMISAGKIPAGGNSADANWGVVSTYIVPPSAITGATFSPTNTPSEGGEVAITLTGSNLNTTPANSPNIYVQFKNVATGDWNLSPEKATVEGATTATAKIILPPNTEYTSPQKYKLYVLVAEGAAPPDLSTGAEIGSEHVVLEKSRPIVQTATFKDETPTNKQMPWQGGKVYVDLTGTNLDDTGKDVYVQFLNKKGSSVEGSDRIKLDPAKVTDGGKKVSLEFDIKPNEGGTAQLYYLYVQVTEKGTDPIDKDWTEPITKKASVNVAGKISPTIDSVELDKTELEWNLAGGSVTFTIKGKGLESGKVHLNLRPQGDAVYDAPIITATTINADATIATVTYTFTNSNNGMKPIVLDIYSAVADTPTDPTANWIKTDKTLTIKSDYNGKVTIAKAGTTDNVPSMGNLGGDLDIIVTGENLNDTKGSIWVRMMPKGIRGRAATDPEGTMYAKAEVPEGGDGTMAIAKFKVPENKATTYVYYEVTIAFAQPGAAAANVDFIKNAAYTFDFTVLPTTVGTPVITKVTPGTPANGKVIVTVEGDFLASSDIYVYLDAPSTLAPEKLFLTDTTGKKGTVTLTVPASSDWWAGGYPIYTKIVPLGSPPPAYSADGTWTQQAILMVDKTSTTGPYVESITYEPAEPKTANDITFFVKGGNITANKIWIYHSTQHLDSSKDQILTTSNWHVVVPVGEDGKTGTVTIKPSVGTNCFYVGASKDTGVPSTTTLKDSRHIADFTLGERIDDTILAKSVTPTTIEAKKKTDVTVQFQRNYFPTDVEKQKLYKARAIKAGTADVLVAQPVSLTNFSGATTTPGAIVTGPTAATAVLSFPETVAAGEQYEIQISEDGVSYKTVMLASNKLEKALVTVKSSSTGDGDDDPDGDGGGGDNNVSGEGHSYVSTKELEKAIKDAEADGSSQVVIYVNRNLRVSKEFFAMAQYNKKDIVLQGGNYAWTIPAGSKMSTNMERSYDLGVKYSSTYEGRMRTMVGKFVDYFQPFFILYHGPLPTRMLLTVSTNFARGANLFVYRYNESSDDATLVAEPPTSYDGKTSFYMNQCSHYFITNNTLNRSYINTREEKPGGFYDENGDWVTEEFPDDNTIFEKPNPNTGLA